MTGELVKTERLWSIDAFRGFTMICMLGEGFGMRHVAQFEHVSWNIAIPGDLHFWDLIQPFFMFIVGTVMPISFARRWAGGETWRRSLMHVLRRSALLILLGLFARSVQAQRPVLDLINVLAQIAFTYLVAFLLLRQPWPVQGGVALGLLAIHWAIFYSYGPDPWAKDANLGWYLDRLLLHKTWSGSYATINCLSSAANTIFGMMAGELLASGLAWTRKARILAATGVLGVAVGFALSPWIPLNKKIWTASFALYSTGMTLVALLLFYWIFDVIKKRRWARVFIIVGSNSIFIYVFHETLHRYMNYVAVRLMNLPVPAAALMILGVEIAVCWVLYRRRVFLRV